MCLRPLLVLPCVLWLVAGCGRLGFDAVEEGSEPGPTDWVFVDSEERDFDKGDYGAGSGPLEWTGAYVEFAATDPFDAAQIGIFVSATFDTGNDAAVWDTLAWVPRAPHQRPLPNLGAGDSGYASDAINMEDNILLLHFNEEVGAQDDVVVDSSGTGNDGRLVLDGQGAAPTSGEFGNALDLERDAWVTLDGANFDYGTGDFTYSVWTQMRGCAESNNNRIAVGGAGAGDSPHMWIGARCPDTCPDGDGAFMNFLDDSRTGPSLRVCTGVVLDDGAWHHLAGVKRGHTSPASLVQLFVDGREVDAEAYDFGDNTFTYDDGEIRLGSFNLNDPTYHTSIVVDEAAIWKRALSNAEIEALYLRGALELGLQFRACPDGTCDDEIFVGPDGTSESYFSEAELIGEPGSQSGNLAALGLVGARGQYRARFATTSPTASPGLGQVTVRARLP